MEIIRTSSGIKAYSWTTGAIQPKKETPLDVEAKKNPQAVIFRLLREGKEDDAERLFDRYV